MKRTFSTMHVGEKGKFSAFYFPAGVRKLNANNCIVISRELLFYLFLNDLGQTFSRINFIFYIKKHVLNKEHGLCINKSEFVGNLLERTFVRFSLNFS